MRENTKMKTITKTGTHPPRVQAINFVRNVYNVSNVLNVHNVQNVNYVHFVQNISNVCNPRSRHGDFFKPPFCTTAKNIYLCVLLASCNQTKTKTITKTKTVER